ncbi:MAG: PDZ domain-containing protein [Micromonosporaceae bacterium]|nr:PDZ domain-containing protein [Micromonosporaceae bacterium]
MRQRGLTVLVGAVVVIVCSLLVAQTPVPYVALQPGQTYDTLGVDSSNREIIVIDGAATSESAGQLRFLTVGVVPELTLLEAVIGWVMDDEAVVPRELIYPPEESREETERRNAEDFANSLSAAQVAALSYLGYSTVVAVKEVLASSPNADRLKAGDIITAVDGVPVTSADALLSAIQGKPAGSTLTFALTRDGEPLTVEVTTAADEDGVPRVGFAPEVRSSAPFTITIPIEGIGGPSAGLMMALGIIDKLQPEDLTGGMIIAGTGTIDDNGAVGPIGGVPQKIIGAVRAGATVFLTPRDNCAEAVANAKPGLLLVQVDSLESALSALQTLREGGAPPLCPGAPPA